MSRFTLRTVLTPDRCRSLLRFGMQSDMADWGCFLLGAAFSHAELSHLAVNMITL